LVTTLTPELATAKTVPALAGLIRLHEASLVNASMTTRTRRVRAEKISRQLIA